MQNESSNIISPMINQLIEDAKIDGSEIVIDFYHNLAKTAIPLIESSGMQNISFVTFIWMGDETTECVWLYSEMNPSQLPLPMMRINKTAFFYRTFEIASDIRLAYAFLPNVQVNLSTDPMDRMKELRKLMPKFQPDPHNPNHHVVGGTDILFSILEMSNASRNFISYKSEQIPRGVIKSFSIESKILDEERKFYVYTPYNYDQSNEYGILLLFDGQMYLDSAMGLRFILDSLIANQKINPFIAIFVDSMDISIRERDLMCSDNFTKFIDSELLPWIKNNYSIVDDPSKNIISGTSLGGMYALYYAMKNSQAFNNVLINSGAFWCNTENFNNLIEGVAKLNLKVYMDYGSLEDIYLMRKLNQNTADKLYQLGCQVKFQEYKGGHNYYCWRETIGEALEYLLN